MVNHDINAVKDRNRRDSLVKPTGVIALTSLFATRRHLASRLFLVALFLAPTLLTRRYGAGKSTAEAHNGF